MPCEIFQIRKRFDYGFAGCIEIHLVKRLIIGERMNVSLGNILIQRSDIVNDRIGAGADSKDRR